MLPQSPTCLLTFGPTARSDVANINMATTPEQRERLLQEWRELSEDDARYALQFFPPIEVDASRDEEERWKLTSGLDCLAQLLRHIVSHSGDIHEGIEMFLEETPSNPIVFFALQTFRRNKPWPDQDQIAAATNRKFSVLEQVVDPAKGLAAYTFSSLCNSPLMNETFWSLPQTQLFGKVLVQDPATGRWHDRNLSRSDHGRLGVIKWDGLDHPTLQAAVNAAFGPQAGPDGTTAEVRLAWCPEAVRVIYRASNANPVSFPGLYQFDMPLTPYPEGEQYMNERGEVPVCWDVHYRLFAVVRHGRRRLGVPFEQDCVRTYNHIGSKVDMDYTPETCVNDGWLIGEDGVTYTLVYLIRSPLVPDPEAELNTLRPLHSDSGLAAQVADPNFEVPASLSHMDAARAAATPAQEGGQQPGGSVSSSSRVRAPERPEGRSPPTKRAALPAGDEQEEGARLEEEARAPRRRRLHRKRRHPDPPAESQG